MDQTQTGIEDIHRNCISSTDAQQRNFDEYDKIPNTKSMHKELVNRIHILKFIHQDNAYFSKYFFTALFSSNSPFEYHDELKVGTSRPWVQI